MKFEYSDFQPAEFNEVKLSAVRESILGPPVQVKVVRSTQARGVGAVEGVIDGDHCTEPLFPISTSG
jgi:hypothetical protein